MSRTLNRNLNEILVDGNMEKMHEALDQLKELGFPEAQLKDIKHTLNRMNSKRKLKYEKELRRNSDGSL